jgi:hypothetical protein
VVNLAMGRRVFLRICVERRYPRHRDSPSVTYPRIVLLRVGLPVKPLARPSWGMG